MARFSYFTKLTGTSFRQKEIAQLKPGKTLLRIIAQDDNEYDPYACEVQALLDDWTQIGWIAKGKNQDIHEFIKSGGTVDIVLSDVTGQDKETLGVNVGVTYGTDDSIDVRGLDKQICDFGDDKFVFWDKENHKAYDKDGHELQSGSATEHKYLPEPDFTYPAKAIAKKTGLSQGDIMSIWVLKSELAKAYGTLMHRCLENRFLFLNEMDALDEAKERDKTATNWMPRFFGDAADELTYMLLDEKKLDPKKFYTEARLKYKNLTGIADLIYLDGKDFILFDYKTNEKIDEVKYEKYGKLMKYTLQQNHYRTIMEKLGYNCKGMYLLHLEQDPNGAPYWSSIKLDKVNLDEEINDGTR